CERGEFAFTFTLGERAGSGDPRSGYYSADPPARLRQHLRVWPGLPDHAGREQRRARRRAHRGPRECDDVRREVTSDRVPAARSDRERRQRDGYVELERDDLNRRDDGIRVQGDREL